MPKDIADALKHLIGQRCRVVTEGDTFDGVVAGVTDCLLTLANDKGVVYVKVNEIEAVSTNGNGNGTC